MDFEKKPPTRIENFNKIVERFGSSLTIFNPENEIIRKDVEDLGLLPNELVQKMKNLGLKIVMGDGSFISILEKSRGVKYSILELATKLSVSKEDLEQAVGGYNKSTKTIFSTSKISELSTSKILHEYGHGVGHLLNLNKDENFKSFHLELFEKISYYIQQGSPGNPAGVRELIAESFSDYFKLSKEVFVKKYNNPIYKYWGIISNR